MNKSEASKIIESLNSQLSRNFSIKTEQAAGSLSGFRLRTINKPCLKAFLIESKLTNSSYWLLFVDRKRDENYYVEIYPEKHQQLPLAEIHRIRHHEDGSDLIWSYQPRKRDDNNEQRKALFASICGDTEVTISLPGALVDIDDFLEAIFSLAHHRVIADNLDLPPNQNISVGFPEGKRIERKHQQRERNQAVVDIAKNNYAKNNGGSLPCVICGFDFEKEYGITGHNFIEAHHDRPLSDLNDDEILETKPEDLKMVCSNCHRMLHRKRPWVKVEQFKKEFLKKRS